MSEVEGHPYLVRQVMFDAAIEARPPRELLADPDTRRNYLSRYRRWLDRDAKLLGALRAVRDAARKGAAATRLNRAAIEQLLTWGLIIEVPGIRYRVRCKLFEDLCE
jgi:hypothetical protein